MRLRDRPVKRGRVAASSCPHASGATVPDITLSLPDDLLLLLVCEHGGPECGLPLEAVSSRFLRLLRGAPLWKPWALARFPVLRSILGALPADSPRCAPDYRALYRVHRSLEARTKEMRFEKVGLLYSAPLAWPTPNPPSEPVTSLDDYVLTVQIFSYNQLLASSSCSRSTAEVGTLSGHSRGTAGPQSGYGRGTAGPQPVLAACQPCAVPTLRSRSPCAQGGRPPALERRA